MDAARWVFRPPYALPAAVYAAVCVAMWPLPVVGLLHVESSAVVAGVGFFASGLSALALFRDREPVGQVILRHASLLAVPLVLLTASLLWRPNCGYPLGLLLFVTFTLPSVALGASLAYALDGLELKRPHLWFMVGGVMMAILPVAYDLGLHPQFFTYNHVWGGILGPLYDEELAIRPGLFFFRGLTVWWAVALMLIGLRARRRRAASPLPDGRETGLSLLAVTLVIAGTYAAAPWLGINSPGRYIQDRLGGHLRLDRFDIYYDPGALSDDELRVISDAHRYRYRQLRQELGADVPYRIATYLYPDAATKAALTGSRTTSVVPTWLPVPQMHLLQDRFEASFAHELAHVVAREFGMPFLRASPAIGLVEGLAVATEPPDGLPGLHAQVAAALRHREALGVYRDSLAAGIATQLRPLGFWTGRGAVSYVTMGSFVRYLLDAHGYEPIQRAYRTGRFEEAFGRPVEALAREWEHHIRRQPDDPEAVALVMTRFTRPSLFERRCPHHVPRAIRELRRSREALREGDVRGVDRALASALRADSTSEPALVAWAGFQLARGDADDARRRLERAVERGDTLAGAALVARLGDAYRLTGNHRLAEAAYGAALERLPPYAREQRATLRMRAAMEPEVLRILLEPLPAARRAELLEDAPGGSGFSALLWAEAGDFSRAAALMQASAPLLPPGERLAWQSAYVHATGDRRRAATLAREAAAALEAEGAHAAAARQLDRAELLWWHILRETDTHEPNVPE